MSPGRASSALTTRRPLLPCSALRTHVATAAQPLAGILCPALPSAQFRNDAHHGLPGGPPAAAPSGLPPPVAAAGAVPAPAASAAAGAAGCAGAAGVSGAFLSRVLAW